MGFSLQKVSNSGYTGHISYQSTTEKCIQHKILNNDHIKQMVEELT